MKNANCKVQMANGKGKMKMANGKVQNWNAK